MGNEKKKRFFCLTTEQKRKTHLETNLGLALDANLKIVLKRNLRAVVVKVCNIQTQFFQIRFTVAD